MTGGRAQANLPVVAVALVVLTAATGAALAMAEGALVSAERDAPERSAAASAADRLVAADADVTRRANVLDRDRAFGLTADELDAIAPPVADAEVRVRIADVTVVERGDPAGGTTMRRIALLAETDEWTGSFDADEELTVPRRTDSVTVSVDGHVETLRVDDRVVLHDPAGIGNGTTASVPRYETLTITAEGEGTVEVVAAPETTEKALVEVTVDA